jgi:nucleotide-binding universal stress UspA family protein
MKTILVGVDGSSEADKAASQATALCKQTGARILFAFAHPPPRADEPLLPEFSESDRARRQHGRTLLERAQRAAASEGVDAEVVSAEGPPAEVLAEIAAAAGVDLVVVGHRGRGAVTRVLLGSTADRLVQISPRPVLVVR